MQVQVVSPEFIYQVWPTVETYFKRSEMFGVGDCTAEQLKLQLVSGALTLLVAVDSEVIKGACAMQMINLPNHRVAMITALGGKTFEHVVSWAKHQGATKIRAWAKDAQARLYRQKVGLNTTTHVVEKLI